MGVMKRVHFAGAWIGLAVCFSFLVAGCSKNVDAELKAVFQTQLDAMNKEDMDAYMASIDPEAGVYASTKATMPLILQTYDVKATMDSFEVVSKTEDSAQVRTVIVTKKVSGPDFKDNKVTALHTLKLKNGKWLLTETKVEKIDFL
jgi:hypothetical protein